MDSKNTYYSKNKLYNNEQFSKVVSTSNDTYSIKLSKKFKNKFSPQIVTFDLCCGADNNWAAPARMISYSRQKRLYESTLGSLSFDTEIKSLVYI